MLLKTLYDDKLAQASYLVGCQATGEALVVDPNRDAGQYLALAKKHNLRITHVTETHIHADFLSGTRELTERAGARMHLSAHGGQDWSYRFGGKDAVLLRDGDHFMVGNLRFDVMHTPGHTPEHICFIVTDTRAADRPMGIFTGDFVFVGDVGRPDLLEKAAGVADTMRAGAADLFRSLERFRTLPDYLQVWPGHGAGSACGKALGAVPQSTVGYEKMVSPPLSFATEAEFIEYILSGQPEPPKYFAEMKRLNRDGPPLIGELKPPARLDDAKIAELLESGAPVIDTRDAQTFGRGHVPGTINIPLNRAFPNWAGWFIPYDRDFALIIDDDVAHAPYEAARDLALIGLDNSAGYFGTSVLGWWRAQQGALETMDRLTTDEMEAALTDDDTIVLDVRGHAEWEAGHIPEVPNLPIGYVGERSSELPRDKRIVTHCQSGGRAAIAASVLQSLGYDAVSVKGGFAEWEDTGRPVEREASADVSA